MLTPAELAAALKVSTRTVARWDAEGCPCEWAGSRRRYDIDSVKIWNRERACQSAETMKGDTTRRFASAAAAFTDACRSVQLRVTPSGLRQS